MVDGVDQVGPAGKAGQPLLGLGQGGGVAVQTDQPDRRVRREYGLGVTTPNEMARLFELLAEGKAVSARADSAMLDILENNQKGDMMQRLLVSIFLVTLLFASQALAEEKADVKAIGLSGQMHGSVFLDKNGQVVRKALLWNDQRTAAECEEIERRAGGRKQLIKMVANPALTGFTAPKILWLRNHEPRNFEKTVKVLLPKDDVRRRLTGEFATDVSDASGMLLLDVKQRTWSKKLLDKLELLAKRDSRRLMAVCGVDAEDLADMIAEIRALDPKPAASYDANPAPTLVPDLLMTQTPDGIWLIENGKREPKLSVLQGIAAALGVPLQDLLRAEAPSRRAGLEIDLAHFQQSQAYASLGLPLVRGGRRLPAEASGQA